MLKELLDKAKTPYISEDVVIPCLAREAQMYELREKNTSNLFIEPNKTLSELNSDIVNQVLLEEGMNKKHAAERLGIARSTLWRIIKSEVS